jgi:hypothetical protein
MFLFQPLVVVLLHYMLHEESDLVWALELESGSKGYGEGV